MELVFLKEQYKEKTFSAEEYVNLNCPMNSHFDMEMVVVKDGEILVEKNGETFFLKKNNAIIIMPFEVHKFITAKNSEVLVLTITPTVFPEYKSRLENKMSNQPVIMLEDESMEYVFNISHIDIDDVFGIKSVFYLLLSAFQKNGEFVPCQNAPNALFEKVVMYVSEHFNENITLKKVATDLHVSYVHLSRVINNEGKISFPMLLNSFRFEQAIRLLKNTNKSVSEIAYECGWESIRSMNRIFKETLSCTPGEFRKNIGNYDEWKYYDIPMIYDRERSSSKVIR